ncbi:MAG: L-arabinose isomerase [Bacteroidota bacterium]
MNNSIASSEVWFITGSQHLYGPEVLEKVTSNSHLIAKSLDADPRIIVRLIPQEVLKSPEEIYHLCLAANAKRNCVGIIAWMHTFSPAKMWIKGLKSLQKPLLHLHTQFNETIPYDSIDMDFMNLNQSAHGGREFGFICSRMGINRRVVSGHWKEERVIEELNKWTRVARAWQDCQNLKIARFGDNMREVAVTEGNKVSAQIQFGYSVNGYGLGDLTEFIQGADKKSIHELIEAYEDEYLLAPSLQKEGSARNSLVEAARIEQGLRSFLEEGGFGAFTDTFENLHGLQQLPGLAVQRLMQEGYGFGAEGDWKTAALVRNMKVMGQGLKGGCSFMEDYTYHLDSRNQEVLGAHMLEICPSISKEKASCEIYPLGIGGKSDPVRLVFTAATGEAINASLIDLGHRFRLIVNEVEAVEPPSLPKLPVARALWKPLPNLATAATAWIYAGGAHHTAYSQSLDADYLEMFAEIAGIEVLFIDEKTELRQFKKELGWNEPYYSK